MRFLSVIGMAVGLSVALPAQAGTNALSVPVNRLPEPASFEALTSWGHKHRYVWCAAARAALADGASYRDRLYVSVPIGPSRTVSGKEGVSFTYRPDDALLAQGSRGTTTLTKTGNNISIRQGTRYCVKEIDS